MAPSATAQADGLLEHPTQVFDFYRASGVNLPSLLLDGLLGR